MKTLETQGIMHDLTYKSSEERNSSSGVGTIEDEYEAVRYLGELYNPRMPGGYVEPVKMEYDEEGSPRGYWMEKIDGIEIGELINDPEDYDINIDFVVDQLEHLKNLTEYLPAHGDIYEGNLLVEEDTGLLRIIDPKGWDFRTAMQQTNQRKDQRELDEFIEALESHSNAESGSVSMEEGILEPGPSPVAA